MTTEHADRTLDEIRKDSALSYEHAIAAQRLQLTIQQAIDSYLVTPGVKPSRWIARALIQKHPDMITALWGKG